MQTFTIALAVLIAFDAFVRAVSLALHYLAPKTKTPIDDRAAAAVDKLHTVLDGAIEKLKSIAGPAALVVLVILLPASALVVVACSSTQRADTLAYTTAGIDTAAEALQAYGPPHELALVKAAPTTEAAYQAVSAWETERTKLEADIRAAYQAVKIATEANDGKTLQAAIDAGTALAAELAKLGIGDGK